jgi:hypothetical protein
MILVDRLNPNQLMKTSNLVIWLSAIIAVLAVVAASIGLFWQDGGNLFSFVTLRGDTVSIAGRGLYRYDTTLMAIGFKAGDAATLILVVPALIFALLRYQRGSMRGELLLAGTLLIFCTTMAQWRLEQLTTSYSRSMSR